MKVPKYENGDYGKVEFSGEATSVGEWMWVHVYGCDDAKQLVFGALDSVPVNDSTGRLKVGTQLAISFSQVRDHKKSADFDKLN